MKKVAFIGAGGINSWAITNFYDMCKLFDKEELMFVKIFDNDEVEEKNLRRGTQNFSVDDLMMSKAEVLANKYNYMFENVFITEENIQLLDNFDDIILGVDNNKTRQLLYKYCLEKNKYLLDMRAQGTQISYYVLDHTKDIDYYNKKFFNNITIMERKGSCQMQHDVENDNFQNGNKIIAYMGIYGIYLKHLREEELTTKEFAFVY